MPLNHTSVIGKQNGIKDGGRDINNPKISAPWVVATGSSRSMGRPITLSKLVLLLMHNAPHLPVDSGLFRYCAKAGYQQTVNIICTTR